jgi:hypothetical protein
MPSTSRKRKAEKVNETEAEVDHHKTHLALPIPGLDRQRSQQLLDDFLRQIEAEERAVFGDIAIMIREMPAPDPEFGPHVPAGAAHNRERAISKAMDEEAAKILAKRPQEKKKLSSSIVSKIDPSFFTYIRNDTTPGGANELYDAGDVIGVIRHLKIWYERAMGLLPVVAGVVDEKLIKDARSEFDKVHQKYEESVEDFITRFKANVDLLRRIAGVVLTEKSKAYEFLTKLNRSVYGEKLEKMAEEEATQLRYLTNNPGQPRLLERGYPQTFAEATMQARQWEISTTAKRRKTSTRREKKADQEAVEEAGVSYSKIDPKKVPAPGKKKPKAGKKPREKIKLTAEQMKALPPSTKATEYGYDECKKEHDPGQSADHFNCHCPAKSTTISRAAIPGAPTPGTISETDIQRIASIVAETMKQEAFLG